MRTQTTCRHWAFTARLKGRRIHKRCADCRHRWTETVTQRRPA
ncbi:MAG: hypothetical protein ACRDQ7_09305 [Haloechinothrix sp.]